MAAPLGNQNAKQAKIWQQALKRALARRANSTVDRGLDDLADKVLDIAFAGESWAIQEVGNRMDGKPANETELTATFEGKVSGVAPCYGLQPSPDSPTS